MSGAAQQPAHDDHGHSVAAWTAVVIMIIGSLVGALAFVISSPPVFWVAVAIVAVGLIAGKVLQVMGFGVDAARASAAGAERASA